MIVTISFDIAKLIHRCSKCYWEIYLSKFSEYFAIAVHLCWIVRLMFSTSLFIRYLDSFQTFLEPFIWSKEYFCLNDVSVIIKNLVQEKTMFCFSKFHDYIKIWIIYLDLYISWCIISINTNTQCIITIFLLNMLFNNYDVFKIIYLHFMILFIIGEVTSNFSTAFSWAMFDWSKYYITVIFVSRSNHSYFFKSDAFIGEI